MTGNAWQWVADWYRADQFRREATVAAVPQNPTGPTDSWDPTEPGVPVSAPKRVTRGGSFLCNEDFASATARAPGAVPTHTPACRTSASGS
jgi:formylglycine-generating enzyme required for sulfatase activity